MSRRYPDEPFDDYQDRVTDDARQRELDDKVEQAALQDAFLQGQRAGNLGLSSSLNPFDSKSPEHAEWERARSTVIGARLNGHIRRVA